MKTLGIETSCDETAIALYDSDKGIIGESIDLTLKQLEGVRDSTLIMNLTNHLLLTKWQDEDGNPKLYLFGQLKRIVKKWLNECLVCRGDTYPALLMYKVLADTACERITAAIVKQETEENDRQVMAVLAEKSTSRIGPLTLKVKSQWRKHCLQAC